MAPDTSHFDPAASAQWAAALIQHRQTVLPKRLAEPGPDDAQLEQIFRAAAAAPDHGERLPWRFVLIPATARERLAEVFAASLLERDAEATAEQVAQAREKAFRSPTLMLAVVNAGPAGDDIPFVERLVSAGCAVQNMLLMATALGFASALTSGKAMESKGLRELFGLRPSEHAVTFISIGTAGKRKAVRQRPEPARFVSTLG
jgi:nitroreductase